MKTIKNYKVPTGNIIVSEGDFGLLEYLSIGDYGKHANIKADFLGLSKEICGVPNQEIMPLSEKWVITVSNQYGCSMNCTFCDVPKVGSGMNVSYYDLLNQIKGALALHPEITSTKRLNIHFARMGEPTFNGNILDVCACLKRNMYNFCEASGTIHPVISTMMPKNNKNLKRFLKIWLQDIKGKMYLGEAGLQISINTTDEKIREITMPYAMELLDISKMLNEILSECGGMLRGRKITLNFALTSSEIDEHLLKVLFSPIYFMCKITPMHMTKSCEDNKLLTKDGYTDYYPYKEVEERLKSVGFDVLVFIPSEDEDKSRITCGNAILSGTKPECKYKEV